MVPDKVTKPYALLARAMEAEGKVGIAHLVMRTKQYLAAIRPQDGRLVLSTMVYADELNDPGSIPELADVADIEVTDRELAMATQLVESLSTDFEPDRFQDTYREAVLGLIDRKAAGEEVIAAPTEAEPDRVVDLMAALEASVAAAKESRTQASHGSPGRRRRPTTPPRPMIPIGRPPERRPACSAGGERAATFGPVTTVGDGVDDEIENRYVVEVDPSAPNNAHAIALGFVGFDRDVLEVGAGAGHVTRVLAERGNRVTAVDIDPVALESAAPFASSVHSGDLDVMVLDELVGPGPFDAVLMGDVLEHLRDPVATLRAARRVLRPGGSIVVSVPNVAHIDLRLHLFIGRWQYQPIGLLDATHVRFFTRETLEEALAQAGLRIVATGAGLLAGVQLRPERGPRGCRPVRDRPPPARPRGRDLSVRRSRQACRGRPRGRGGRAPAHGGGRSHAPGSAHGRTGGRRRRPPRGGGGRGP